MTTIDKALTRGYSKRVGEAFPIWVAGPEEFRKANRGKLSDCINNSYGSDEQACVFIWVCSHDHLESYYDPYGFNLWEFLGVSDSLLSKAAYYVLSFHPDEDMAGFALDELFRFNRSLASAIGDRLFEYRSDLVRYQWVDTMQLVDTNLSKSFAEQLEQQDGEAFEFGRYRDLKPDEISVRTTNETKLIPLLACAAQILFGQSVDQKIQALEWMVDFGKTEPAIQKFVFAGGTGSNEPEVRAASLVALYQTYPEFGFRVALSMGGDPAIAVHEVISAILG